MVWLIDEKELFVVNNDLNIEVRNINGQKAIIIDNFYKNPDAIRDLIIKSPASRWDKIRNNLPGYRNVLGIDLTGFTENISKITEKVFKTQVFDINLFTSNLFKNTGEDLGIGGIPHSDPYYFSGIVYFNTEEEAKGGTAFFINKNTGSMLRTPNEPEHIVREDYKYKFLTETDQDWELVEVIEMKYNRFVLYKSNIYHSPYIKSEWFHDYYRLNQVFFYSKVLNEETYIKTIKFPAFEKIMDFNNISTRLKTSNSGYVIIQNLESEVLNDFLSLADGRLKFSEILFLLLKKYDLKNEKILTAFRQMLKELILSGCVLLHTEL